MKVNTENGDTIIYISRENKKYEARKRETKREGREDK